MGVWGWGSSSGSSAVVAVTVAATSLGAVVALAYVSLVRRDARRAYTGGASVASEYDQWDKDGVLEHFWGVHIHHGHYGVSGRDRVPSVEAKERLLNRLIETASLYQAVAGVAKGRPGGPPPSLLDVGCGIGGSSCYLARSLGKGLATEGVTLSPRQCERAGALAAAQGLEARCRFRVADALDLPHADASFDVVWSLESGEHMPDKRAFVRELVRVAKPGGTIVVATWCHRSTSAELTPLTKAEAASLARVYDEWALPPFCSIDDYVKLFDATGAVDMDTLVAEDWSVQVAKTWPMAIWDGFLGLPWLLARGPSVFWRTVRDVFAIKHMMRGFRKGYVTYAVIVAKRKG